jgi:hypothetical protein
LGEELSNVGGCNAGGRRTGFGGFNNDWELKDFFALGKLFIRLGMYQGSGIRGVFTVLSGVPDSQKSF